MSVGLRCPNPRCGRPAPAGVDFCPSCHTYLAWDRDVEPTTAGTVIAEDPLTEGDVLPAVANGNAHENLAQVEESTRFVAITLAGADVAREPRFAVEPGGSVKVRIALRNQSKIVDKFKISVEGFHDWWSVEPKELNLLPFGADRPKLSEGEAVVTLAPRRDHTATAGDWPVRLVVRSADSNQTDGVDLTVEVREFKQIGITFDPEIQPGRLSASFVATITNEGNKTTEKLVLFGTDPERACRVAISPPEVATVAAGASVRPRLVVKPVMPQPVGRRVDRPITVIAGEDGTEVPEQPAPMLRQLRDHLVKRFKKAAEGQAKQGEKTIQKAVAVPGLKPPGKSEGSEPAASTGPNEAPVAADRKPDNWDAKCTYSQRALLPWWTPLLIALIALLIAFELHLFQSRVKVPWAYRDVSTARATVAKAGLSDQEVVATQPWNLPRKYRACKPRPSFGNFKAGIVYKMVPAEGVVVGSGTTVLLCTYVSQPPRTVPNLYGMASKAAQQFLRRNGFAIGDIEPFPIPPHEVIIGQTPKAGTRATTAADEEINVTMGLAAVVPDLLGQTLPAANIALQKLGFVLYAENQSSAPPDAVIAQQLTAANLTKDAGTEIEVKLGLRMPKVSGLGPAAAKAKLQAAGMRRGTVRPAAPRANYVVKAQKPAAGTLTTSRSYALTLGPPPQKQKPAAKSSKAAGKSASVAVPAAAAGGAPAAAAAKLAKAGVKTRRIEQLSSTVRAGKLIRTIPGPGAKVKKGSVITLVVSAGYPEVAVDNGHEVLALNGVTGKPVGVIAGGPIPATQPSWAPAGNAVAYVSSGRILLTAEPGQSGPRALTPAGADYALPTFPAATTAPAVIAAIHPARGADQLCLLSTSQPKPSCVRTGFTLGPEIAWSPHGTELLVGARSGGSSPATRGLLELTSRRPFSTRAADWRVHGIVTPVQAGAGVQAAAFSPNGLRFAATEDFGGPFTLALTAPSDLTLAKAQTFAAPTPACTVQWRTDSAQVLVQTSPSPDCGAGLGALYVVDPAQPKLLSVLASKVENPSWQPIPGVE